MHQGAQDKNSRERTPLRHRILIWIPGVRIRQHILAKFGQQITAILCDMDRDGYTMVYHHQLRRNDQQCLQCLHLA